MDTDARLLSGRTTHAEVVLGYESRGDRAQRPRVGASRRSRRDRAAAHRLSLDRGYSWPRDVRVRHANGTYVTMAVSDLDPMTEARDQFVVTLRHVQVLRQSAPTRRRAERAVGVLHHVSDAVIAVDGDGQVIFRNRAATESVPVRRDPRDDAASGRADARRRSTSGKPMLTRTPSYGSQRGDKVPRYEARVDLPGRLGAARRGHRRTAVRRHGPAGGWRRRLP